VIENSLFITGCWKMTWAWIEETGKEPNGREEKWTTLSVVLDQGLAKKAQGTKGIVMQSKS
jgi:hypothetical protein